MRQLILLLAAVSLLATVSLLAAEPAAAGIDARMLRFPDVSATDIAFVYAGDIWVVPKEGGVAQRLSTPAGQESFPRFSGDGSRIAFTGNYDGNGDVYVIPTGGGVPVRVTHHPENDRLLDWFPGGEELLFASRMASGRSRFRQLYRTAGDGGLPQKLPLPYGEFAAIAPDGKTLAFMPNSRDFRTWKRYRGGTTPDIWLFDLEDHASRNLTDHEANDSQPMWHGASLYFLSDRGPQRKFNLWVLPEGGGAARQVTHFEDFDVQFPAIGPSDIVFQKGGRLFLLELAGEQVREVEVEVVTDQATLKPRAVPVAELAAAADISPSGKRAVVEARGEIFTLPAEHGFVRNLTRSSGVAERTPTWSPDGETIAYFSDRSGEYELTLRPADGSGEERTVTSLGAGFRYRPQWSPDSKKLAFVDQAMRIRLYDLEADRLVEVDRGLWMYHFGLQQLRFSWSADSRWLAFDRAVENLTSAVFLFDTKNAELHQVTSAFYSAQHPTFDPDGKYLYVLWNRSLQPSFSDLQFSWIFANTTQIAAIPLRRDVPSPLAPRNDEEGEDEDSDAEDEDDGEETKDKKKKKGKKGDEDEDEDSGDDEPEPVEIDLEGFEGRLVTLPAEAGNYWRLRAASGKVIYQRFPRTGETLNPFGANSGDVVYFDLEEREEKTVLEEVDGFELAAGGEKLLAWKGDDSAIVDLEPEQKLEKMLAAGDLETVLDPRAEWRQLYRDAWRFQRDYFYDPGMHGLDWPAMYERYAPLLEDAVTRGDVNWVIGELIAELSASHTYRGGGDMEQPEQRGVGLLGCDFELADGHYRIADIIDLPPWESSVRSPLRSPGVDVDEGDYLLAVNGAPLDATKDPWAAFQGLAGKTVMLTVGESPSLEDARQVLVETLASESRLRNLAWIEGMRQRVEEASDGRVGYIYVPDTAIGGQTELVRQFRAQYHLDGLIIDERFNSGGFTTERMIELLRRPLLAYRGVRDGPDWQNPNIAHVGVQVMLINAWSGSGGDLFPYAFRHAGLGPLIGTRTWGGVIGISGSPQLIDGGAVTVPTFGTYGLDGEWIIEGHGVEPDIEVPEDPTAMAGGEDPQLERAIEEVLRRLAENPPRQPDKPAYPDLSGD